MAVGSDPKPPSNNTLFVKHSPGTNVLLNNVGTVPHTDRRKQRENQMRKEQVVDEELKKTETICGHGWTATG